MKSAESNQEEEEGEEQRYLSVTLIFNSLISVWYCHKRNMFVKMLAVLMMVFDSKLLQMMLPVDMALLSLIGSIYFHFCKCHSEI